MTGGLHLVDGGAATKRYPDVLGRVDRSRPRQVMTATTLTASTRRSRPGSRR